MNAKVIYALDFVAKLQIPNSEEYPLNPARLDETIDRWLKTVAPDASFPFSNGISIKDVGDVRYFVERTNESVVVRKLTAPYSFISID